MRVVHVTPYFAPAFNYGGPPRSILGLGKALADQGVDVEVVTTTAAGDRDLPADHDSAYEGLRVSYLRRTPPRAYFRAAKAREVLIEKCATADVMHVHGCWNFLGWTAAAIASRRRVRYVMTPRGMLSPWSMTHGRRWLKAAAYRVYEQPAQLRATAHHATSTAERDELTALGFVRQIAVIPNGVDIPSCAQAHELVAFRERFGLPEGRRLVLTLGRLHPKKGLEILGDAMKRVGAAGDATLLVAGSGDPAYERQITRWLRDRLGDRVTFTGQLEGRDRDLAYLASDVFVLTSAAENFGLVVAEAMAAGLPVVVSRDLPWRAVEQWEAGRVVSRDDPASVAKAITAYLSDASAARTAGQQGRAIVQREFSWPAVAKQMTALYRECLNWNAS